MVAINQNQDNGDDAGRQSADDALEPYDDIFSPTRDEEKLAEDNDPPSAPADDIFSSSPLDEPATDDGVDPDELYQEGLKAAADADDEEVDTRDTGPQPLQPEED